MGDKDPNTGTPPGKVRGTELFEAYRQMLAYLFISTVVVVILISVPLIVVAVLNQKSPGVDEADFPVFALVPFCGALGAFFSSLMRLYSVTELPAALLHVELKKLRNRYLFMYSLIPPIVGMIAASVLYIALLGDLIGGEMFPEFACKIEDCGSFVGLFSFGPAAAGDYAKTLVWAFISGFSERLVPDSLKGLSSSAK